MIISKVVTPAGMSEQEAAPDTDANPNSMSQQNIWDPHGHEMHPQQFVRLVGCHDAKAGHHETQSRLH